MAHYQRNATAIGLALRERPSHVIVYEIFHQLHREIWRSLGYQEVDRPTAAY